MTTPTATPSAGEPVAPTVDELVAVDMSDFHSEIERRKFWNWWVNSRWSGLPWSQAKMSAQDAWNARAALSPDPYPWLARGAIPPYQPPFPGE